MPSNATMEVKEIWKQPDGAGYRPCLEFGIEYVRTSAKNGFLYNFIHDRSYTYSCSGFQAPLLPDPLGDKMVMNTGSLGFQVLTLQNGAGYKPCLEAVINDPRTSEKISKQKRRFLVVVASGGLNQIIDAVVIATVLEAALVVPTLQVNFIWGDESEFSDIFDVERRTRHGAFNPLQPEFLIGRLNMSYEQQKFAGLCPLNALEVARLLKALGAPGSGNRKQEWCLPCMQGILSFLTDAVASCTYDFVIYINV